MATSRITVRLKQVQADAIRTLVAEGHVASVSAFVRHGAGLALQDAEEWRQMLDDALQQTGGPLTEAERQWADSILPS